MYKKSIEFLFFRFYVEKEQENRRSIKEMPKSMTLPK
jgi:hypothetical protein